MRVVRGRVAQHRQMNSGCVKLSLSADHVLRLVLFILFPFRVLQLQRLMVQQLASVTDGINRLLQHSCPDQPKVAVASSLAAQGGT